MLRRVLQVAASKGRQNRLYPTTASTWRCFSDFGGGTDGGDDERVHDIYSDLFGAGDEAGDGMGQSFGGGQESADMSSGLGRQREAGSGDRNSGPTDEGEASLEEQEIPVRLWSDGWEIPEEMFHSKITFDDIPDWSPDFVSRISQERVQLAKDGIPTLSSLASLPLPPPPFPHPGHGTSKQYVILRRRAHQEYINQEAAKLAEPKIARILALQTWQEKQDAVDELFESVEFALRDAEPILQGHPQFGTWVERALESYLKSIGQGEEEPESLPQEATDDTLAAEEAVEVNIGEASEANEELEATGEAVEGDGDSDKVTEDIEASATVPEAVSESPNEKIAFPSEEDDEKSLPVFMECYNADDPEDQVVPSVLTPLKPHHNMGAGRMVEEWELAAHDTTKRIMLRQSTRAIARALEKSRRSRVFVTGRRGVGKTAALAAIVASARKSGHIVLYMPDGNRLHRNGYYIVPNMKREGMFDLPILSQEVCKEFLSVHEDDLGGMEVGEPVMKQFFADDQLEEMKEYSGGNISLVDLLKMAQSSVSNAPMCYTVVLDHLMKQEKKPFLMVLDEFNCYFEPGHYFHMEYDEDVNDAIPYDQINLFKPALDAMALSLEDDEDIPLKAPVVPKRGGIVVGISESCAIARKVTDSLSAYAKRSSAFRKMKGVPLSVIDVPRFSELEVDHVLANFESIGIGNLRCDRGETVMNQEGIDYVKMVSGKVGQNLIDVCCS